MGFFPLKNHPPPLHVASVNMIVTSFDNPIKGKLIFYSILLSPFKDIHQTIQSRCDDQNIDYHLVVALDSYHLSFWLDPPHLYIIFCNPSIG